MRNLQIYTDDDELSDDSDAPREEAVKSVSPTQARPANKYATRSNYPDWPDDLAEDKLQAIGLQKDHADALKLVDSL